MTQPVWLQEAAALAKGGSQIDHACYLLSEKYGESVTESRVRKSLLGVGLRWSDLRSMGRAETKGTAPASATEAVARDVRLILPDAHIQAHHRKGFATMKAVARDLKPTLTVIIGDWTDTYSLTHHPKRQPGVVRFEDETADAERELDKTMNAAQARDTVYIEGNHEGWAETYEAENPNLEGTLSIPKKLRLSEKGVKWVPLFEQDEAYRIGDTAYLHGVYEGTNAARQHAEILGPKIMCKRIVFGHCHSMQSWTSLAGYSARCCGFLGDDKHVAFKYRKGRPSPWVLGFLIEEIVGRAVTYTEVRIDYDTGRAAFMGRSY